MSIQFFDGKEVFQLYLLAIAIGLHVCKSAFFTIILRFALVCGM